MGTFSLTGHILSCGSLPPELLRGSACRAFKITEQKYEAGNNLAFPEIFDSNPHSGAAVILTATSWQHYCGSTPSEGLRVVWESIHLKFVAYFILIWLTAVPVGDSESAVSVSLQSEARLNPARHTGFGLHPLCFMWPSPSRRAGDRAGPTFCGRIPRRNYFAESQNTI